MLAALHAFVGCAAQRPVTGHDFRHGTIYCDLDTPEAHTVRKTAPAAVKDVADALGLPKPASRVEVLVFPSRWQMRAYLRRRFPDRWRSEALCFETERGFEVAMHLSGDAEQGVRLLRHEMAHYVLASFYYDMPPWVDEGLARYFETGPPFGVAKPEELRLLASALDAPAGVLDDLVVVPAGQPITEAQYAQGWALTHYLIHRPGGGMQDVVEYLRVVRSGDRAAVSFESVFGHSPRAIEPAWRRHARALMAESPG